MSCTLKHEKRGVIGFMTIVSTKAMLLDAQKKKYAVPAFNIHNLETIQVIIKAANELKSPVILAASPGTVKYAEPEYLVGIVRAAAKKYDIPIALHLDHFQDLDLIKSCIDIGFTSAMIDASHESFEDNIRLTKEIVNFANKKSVTVEAELGRLVGEEDNIIVNERESYFTDPDSALEFVKRTSIDSLAVAIGTAHGLYKSQPKLDFERLEKIQKIVKVPLVLHGASGVPNDSIIKAIELGICKVNIATELKIPFSNALKEYFLDHPDANDPRKYMIPAKSALKEVVKEKIKLCGSYGKAL